MKLISSVHDQNDWFRINMPYHFQKLEDARFRHVYLPLNRHYRPIGEAEGRPDFKACPDRCIVFDSDPHHFEDVWSDPIGLYLYSDAIETKRDYGERLNRLFSQRMRIVANIR
jgi:hypothetical protein